MKIKKSELREMVKETVKRVLTERKSNYVNMDVELPSEGRTAPKISREEFTKHVIDVANELNYDRKIKWYTIAELVRHEVWKKENKTSLSTLLDDLKKIKWDAENLDHIGELRDCKGVPYVLVSAGGDWEVPILFMIYWDGHKFRGYIPTKGNTFDRKRKEALGNNEELDNAYVREYGIGNYNDVSYNKDACIEDFKARLKVK